MVVERWTGSLSWEDLLYTNGNLKTWLQRVSILFLTDKLLVHYMPNSNAEDTLRRLDSGFALAKEMQMCEWMHVPKPMVKELLKSKLRCKSFFT
jgi:hypothetical protein